MIKVRQKGGDERDYHIGGSDASGIVWAIGDRGYASRRIGDEVVVHHGVWNDSTTLGSWQGRIPSSLHPHGSGVMRPMTDHSGSSRLTQEHQLMPKAPGLTWEEAAVPTLVGTTAYRMLHGLAGQRTVGEGDVVLVWGGSGGLGGQAIQLAVLCWRQSNCSGVERRAG